VRSDLTRFLQLLQLLRPPVCCMHSARTPVAAAILAPCVVLIETGDEASCSNRFETTKSNLFLSTAFKEELALIGFATFVVSFTAACILLNRVLREKQPRWEWP
jgi:hypothetical protein